MTAETTVNTTLEADLAAIEKALADHAWSDIDMVREVCGHMLFSPGKRLRPLLVILCSRLGDDAANPPLSLAAAIEYIHVATLLHDDIVDEAELRRGQAAAHQIWGTNMAVLGGDFLLTRAMKIIGELNHPAIFQTVTRYAEMVVEGEIKEMTLAGELDISPEIYFAIVKGKTAMLFQTACECGALAGNLNPHKVEALARFGLNLGMAFQIEDDVNDYLNPNGQGKLAGNDLREGKVTLPLIRALQSADKADRQKVAAVLGRRDLSANELAMVTDFIAGKEAFEAARDVARAYINLALEELALFPKNPAQETLRYLAKNVVPQNQEQL